MDLCVCVCDKKENRNGTTSNANRHQFKTGGLWQLEIPEWINIQHNDVFHFFFFHCYTCLSPHAVLQRVIAAVISVAAQRPCSL
jgi:hypothetical protein